MLGVWGGGVGMMGIASHHLCQFAIRNSKDRCFKFDVENIP